ncbi:hypothetical protein A2U01_0038576 [Trifolium medium]|uniref:Transmembrane protein n=1 Tax=Trifolium medium TaxID=97028 RepID=A0A392Q0S1_9FABA|nr:hypothetical protein [Trifolium medium]
MSGAALRITLVQFRRRRYCLFFWVLVVGSLAPFWCFSRLSAVILLFSVGLLDLRGGFVFVTNLGLDLVSWLWVLFHGGFMGRGFMVILLVPGFVSQILCSWVLLHGGFKHPSVVVLPSF